jgi:hypothetical protein
VTPVTRALKALRRVRDIVPKRWPQRGSRKHALAWGVYISRIGYCTRPAWRLVQAWFEKGDRQLARTRYFRRWPLIGSEPVPLFDPCPCSDARAGRRYNRRLGLQTKTWAVSCHPRAFASIEVQGDRFSFLPDRKAKCMIRSNHATTGPIGVPRKHRVLAGNHPLMWADSIAK